MRIAVEITGIGTRHQSDQYPELLAVFGVWRLLRVHAYAFLLLESVFGGLGAGCLIALAS
jgi:hypothetical protein